MPLDTAEASSPEQGPPREPVIESEPHDQAWARFEETVAHIASVPLEQVQQRIKEATQDLTGKVEDLSRIQRSFEDDVHRELRKLAAALEDLQLHSETTSDTAARERAELHEAVARLAERVDSTVAAMSTRLDVAAGSLKQEAGMVASRLSAQIQQSRDKLYEAQGRDLAGHIAGVSGLLHAIQTEVRTMEEQTNTRQEAAIASLREAFGEELGAASRRSSDADQALGRSLAHLRWTSYMLLALLIAFSAALLVITVGA
jgi:hypothetical protein